MTEFESIYRTYFSDVYRYIRKLSNNEHLAEEITAETFFKAMTAIDTFRGECDLRVWLCQIARNCYYSQLKKAGKICAPEESGQGDLPDDALSLEEVLDQKEQAAGIQQILHTLQEPYREVFMWRVYAELSFSQIGQIFGKSANWACVTYHRARNKIIEAWEAKHT